MRYRLTIWFALIALTALGGLFVLQVLTLRDNVRQAVFDAAEEHNASLTVAMANTLGSEYRKVLRSAALFPLDSEEHMETVRGFDAHIRQTLEGIPVLKVKIYDLDSRTIYSSEPSQIGPAEKENPGVRAGIEGRVRSGYSFRDSFSAFHGTLSDRDVLESYVPVRSDYGPVEAVFELYHDVTPVLERAELASRETLEQALAGFAALFLMLVSIVWWLERRGLGQHAANVELARSAARAQEASRVKSDFLANMSHELRSPLNAVIGFAESMDSEIFGPIRPTRYRNYVQDILGSARFLLRIVDDVLDMAKIERGEVELREEVFSMNELVQEAVRMVEAHRSAEAVPVIVVRLTDDPMTIQGDRGRLLQVLTNVLVNARKFTAADGSITVRSAYEPNGDACVQIEDTGIGIDDKDLERVLFPFVQVGDPYTRHQPGAGLGLSIANALLSLHGGSLTLWSRKGQGTRVDLKLPASRLVVAEAA